MLQFFYVSSFSYSSTGLKYVFFIKVFNELLSRLSSESFFCALLAPRLVRRGILYLNLLNFERKSLHWLLPEKDQFSKFSLSCLK